MGRKGWEALLDLVPDWFFENLPLLLWRWTSVIKRLFMK
jgi:hypothetical protein